MVAHLDGESLRAHSGDSQIPDLGHGLGDGGDVIRPHHQTPEALLGIADGLIDELHLVH